MVFELFVCQASETSRLRRELTTPYSDLGVHRPLLGSAGVYKVNAFYLVVLAFIAYNKVEDLQRLLKRLCFHSLLKQAGYLYYLYYWLVCFTCDC